MGSQTPREAGFFRPSEGAPHRAVWLAFPHLEEEWKEDLDPACEEFAALARAIRDPDPATGRPRGEALEILVRNDATLARANACLKDLGARFHRAVYGDIWLRDTAPLFLISHANETAAVCFAFNGWAQKYDMPGDTEVAAQVAELSRAVTDCVELRAPPERGTGAYSNVGEDAERGEKREKPAAAEQTRPEFRDPGRGEHARRGSCRNECRPSQRKPEIYASGCCSTARVFRVPWVLEGGAVEVDGAGTCLTTESCLLHPQRNPAMTREDLEQGLRETLGVEKILWLKRGLRNDHTDGHIDTLARFIGEAVVVCMEPREASDPNREVLVEIRETLSRLRDAKGRALEVVTLPSPGAVYDREARLMPASYCNFFISNRAVIVPTYGSRFDEEAVACMERWFPGRQVWGLSSRAILTGGGAFHCITQEEPEGREP